MSFLAIDQGTSSTRALLVHKTGAVNMLGQFQHHQSYPQPGWVEHDPDEIFAHVSACLELGIADGATGFGVANQGESCLAWDAVSKTPVSPIIVWQDARTTELCAQMRADGYDVDVAGRAGLPLDPYFSASKLGWIVRHLPEARALHAKGQLRLGTTDAFFRDRLTGRFETDVATASRTSLLNLANGEWDNALCDVFGVPIECLPHITKCNGALGAYAHLPMLASIVDQQGALYGHGCVKTGDTKITFGTGAFALLTHGHTVPNPQSGALPTIAWQQSGQDRMYALEGGVYSASAALNWAQQIGLFSDFGELDRLNTHPRLKEGLCFVPALSGLGCPHWSRDARGSFFGLTLETSHSDMLAAILEGIAYRSAEVLRSLSNDCALNTPIRIDGGLSQNPAFCQMLANICRQDICVSAFAERTALGLALLCAHAIDEDIHLPDEGRLVRHDADYPDLHAAFDRACTLTKTGLGI